MRDVGAKAKRAKSEGPAIEPPAPAAAEVEIGGRRYAIAPLSAGQMRRAVLPVLARASEAGGGDVGVLAEMLDVCLLSLQRASAGPLQDDWEDTLTLGQAAVLFGHVVRLSSRAAEPTVEG
jgi:hypothetical protein